MESEMSGFLWGVMPVEPPPPPAAAMSPSSMAANATSPTDLFTSVVHAGLDPYFLDEAFNLSTIATSSVSAVSSVSSSSATSVAADVVASSAVGEVATLNPFMSAFVDKWRCGHLTVVDNKWHFTVDVAGSCRFWAEGVLSSFVAAFGLLGNLVSIWVLSVPEMRNSFNRLLMALAIIDCMFIMPGILIYWAKAFSFQSEWYNYAFPVFLYPFSETALCSSIYLTVAIAVERYIGLCRPLQRLSSRPCSAKVYIIPVIVIALLLNIPKFLESETVVTTSSHSNTTRTRVGVTRMRTHPYYITYYWMWTRLLATCVVPLLVLALLNTKIYLSIRQSKQQLRVLALRSALPMALLGSKSVPTAAAAVPELIGAAAAAKDNDNNKTARPNGHTNKNRAAAAAAAVPIEGREASVASTASTTTVLSTTDKELPNKLALFQPNRKFQIIPEEEDECSDLSNVRPPNKLLRNGHVPESASPPRPARDASTAPITPHGKLVNGHLRHIQRSASAFEPSLRRSLQRHREPAPILRSNSTSAAAAVTSTNWQSTGSINTSGASGVGGGNADMKLAPILFGVVIVFVLCNSLRVILNVYDFSVVEAILECEEKGVGRLPPPWILCTISVSHLLLMVNSSVNFLVYCVAGTRFRRILMRKVRAMADKLAKAFCKKREGAGTGRTPEEVPLRPAAAAAGPADEFRLQNQQRRNTAMILTRDFSPMVASPLTLKSSNGRHGSVAGAGAEVKGHDNGGGSSSSSPLPSPRFIRHDSNGGTVIAASPLANAVASRHRTETHF